MMNDWEHLKDLGRRLEDRQWWEDDGSIGHQDVSWHPHSRHDVDIFPDPESTYLWLLADNFRRMEAVIAAAKAFEESMHGEWPADRFADLQKALKDLEEHGREV